MEFYHRFGALGSGGCLAFLGIVWAFAGGFSLGEQHGILDQLLGLSYCVSITFKPCFLPLWVWCYSLVDISIHFQTPSEHLLAKVTAIQDSYQHHSRVLLCLNPWTEEQGLALFLFTAKPESGNSLNTVLLPLAADLETLSCLTSFKSLGDLTLFTFIWHKMKRIHVFMLSDLNFHEL